LGAPDDSVSYVSASTKKLWGIVRAKVMNDANSPSIVSKFNYFLYYMAAYFIFTPFNLMHHPMN